VTRVSFQIDADYVGVPPARQVSLFGLNDNSNEQFLTELCRKAGEVNEAKIYFHPETKKHLGIARVVFRHVRGARCAVERFDSASVMGGTVRCRLDPFGTRLHLYSKSTVFTRNPY
jgi:histone-lysine N-methyltransferase SETD1